ncbi:hypothetical protein, partial [Enterobacter hormaechei]|uniref:hypothetical protein n=1 Tax=Enterobacter hormaechei TaxID=158836 RepID=UPI002933209D
MKRIDKIEHYVINTFGMEKLNLKELKDEIDNELVEDYFDMKNDPELFNLIRLYSILKYNITSIEMGYLNAIYNNKEKLYFFEKYFYHANLMVLINYIGSREYGFSLNLSEQGEILLMDFACDDFRIGHFCYDNIIESIQSGKMADSLPMYTRPQKLGVLAIEMLASEKNQTIDWESAGIPIDPFYQRFCQEALYNENHDVVTQWLITLCDKHVEWSALFGINSDEQRSTGYEIDSIILLSWP